MHAQMNLGGANVTSVAAPAVKVQEWTPQMFTKLDKDRASTFTSATMRCELHVCQTRGCCARRRVSVAPGEASLEIPAGAGRRECWQIPSSF